MYTWQPGCPSNTTVKKEVSACLFPSAAALSCYCRCARVPGSVSQLPLLQAGGGSIRQRGRLPPQQVATSSSDLDIVLPLQLVVEHHLAKREGSGAGQVRRNDGSR